MARKSTPTSDEEATRKGILNLASAFRDRYPANPTNGKDVVEAPILVVVLGAAASFRSGMPAWNSLRKELTDTAIQSFD